VTVSPPPDGALTRQEIHERIIGAAEEMIRLFDASEDARTDQERERADKELYDHALGLLARFAGPAIGRVLERERDCPLPSEDETAITIKGTWDDNPAGVNKALAWLLLTLKPALRAFPAERVVRDLLAAVMHNASALTLIEPTRARGEHDHRDQKEAARNRLVFAVLFHAKRAGLSIEAAWEKVAGGKITESTWKAMMREATKERRDAVRAAGKAQTTAEREGRPYALSDPDAVRAEYDLKHNIQALIKRAVSLRKKT
jgi:hypothetical protein